VHFSTGKPERFTALQIRKRLLPIDTPAPSIAVPELKRRGRSRSTVTAASSTAQQLPNAQLPDYDMSDRYGVLEALDELMPGIWTFGHATKVSNICPAGKNFLQTDGQQRPGEPQRIETGSAEILSLIQTVDFSHSANILDMFAGS
jgi:hypothetical protein